MKKFLKIFLISFASLVLLIAVAAAVALWIVFTPSRLTPIVQSQAERFVKCPVEVGRVELTLFSTFPRFGLNIDGISLVNPAEGASCDTLLRVDNLRCAVDINALRKSNELNLSDFHLRKGQICLFVDSLGRANYDVATLEPTDQADTTTSVFPFGLVDIGRVELEDIDFRYEDQTSGMVAYINGMSAGLAGKMKNNARGGQDITFDAELAGNRIGYSDPSMEADVLLADLSLSAHGSMEGDDLNMQLELPRPLKTTMTYGGQTLLEGADIAMRIDAGLRRDGAENEVRVRDMMFSLNGMPLTLQGTLRQDTLTQRLDADMRYGVKSWEIKELLDLVPASYTQLLEGVEADGIISSDGTIKGRYDKESVPVIDANLLLEQGSLSIAELPFPLSGVNANVRIYADVADEERSFVEINNFSAHTPHSMVSTAGRITHLLSDMTLALNSRADINIAEMAAAFMPDTLHVQATGRLRAHAATDFSISHLERMDIGGMKVQGVLAFTDLAIETDSMAFSTTASLMDISLPASEATGPTYSIASFGKVDMSANALRVSIADGLSATIEKPRITLHASDFTNMESRVPELLMDFYADNVKGSVDQAQACVAHPVAHIKISPQETHADRPQLEVAYSNACMTARMQGERFRLSGMELAARASYDPSKEDILSQWMPTGWLDVAGTSVKMAALSNAIDVPSLKIKFSPDEVLVDDFYLLAAGSDYHFTGRLDNLRQFLNSDEAILTGEFDLRSDVTDLVSILNLTSGLGDETQQHEPRPVSVDANGEQVLAGPYMVPKGLDVTIHTDIKQARFGKDVFSNVTGDIKVSNGVLGVGELYFSTPGADLQLTAMYRPDTRNHIFMGVDMHLLNIEIRDLIDMVPLVDSLMPMLRSFDGKGEFHAAVETYTDSLYKVKMSTLRGVASIRGEDLVLLPGETFDRISRMLLFSRKTRNVIDSLSAEATVFRNEIDIYPFLLSMDKYKAVVGGRHNTDMSFDYNISLVESPLPFRLSVRVYGDVDDMHVRLVKNKYPGFYRPTQRNEVQNKEIYLRNLIRESLLRKVVERDESDPTETPE